MGGLTLFVFCLSIPLPFLRIVPVPDVRRDVPWRFHHDPASSSRGTIRSARACSLLSWRLPSRSSRGWSRYFTWLKFKRTPPAVIASPERNYTPTRGSISKLNFWSENGEGRERLLPEIVRRSIRRVELLDRYGLEGLGYPGLWQLLVGYQAAQCDRISWRPQVPDANQAGHTDGRDHLPDQLRPARHSWVSSALRARNHCWLWIPYLVAVCFLVARGYRLKKRVAELVDAAAQRCGFVRIGRKRPKENA